MAGFDFDQDLFNDRIEIAEECCIRDIEFPEAIVEPETDPLPRAKKRKRQKVRPLFFSLYMLCLS